MPRCPFASSNGCLSVTTAKYPRRVIRTATTRGWVVIGKIQTVSGLRSISLLAPKNRPYLPKAQQCMDPQTDTKNPNPSPSARIHEDVPVLSAPLQSCTSEPPHQGPNPSLNRF